MSRSVWKGPYYSYALIDAIRDAKRKGLSIVKTKCRSSFIIPDFIGVIFHVYNGKKYIPVKITEDMIGHKLGEFSPTRTYHGHGVDRKSVRK